VALLALGAKSSEEIMKPEIAKDLPKMFLADLVEYALKNKQT